MCCRKTDGIISRKPFWLLSFVARCKFSGFRHPGSALVVHEGAVVLLKRRYLMGKRIIINLEEVLNEIKSHPIWELAPLFPEIYFPKRKRGYTLNYFILCPFIKEKTPSFCFDVRTRLIACFSCGFHGDIIDFYMRLRNKTFFASVIRLAKFFGIKLVWGKEDAVSKKETILPDNSLIDNDPYREDEQEIPF